MRLVVALKLMLSMVVIMTLASRKLTVKKSIKHPKNLIKATNGLNWVLRLSQLEYQVPFKSRLINLPLMHYLAKYQTSNFTEKTHSTKVMDKLSYKFSKKCKFDKKPKDHIYKATSKLFHSAVKSSEGKASRARIFKAIDPLLNDATAIYLARFQKIKSLSKTIDFLSVDGIKVVDKNSNNAAKLLQKSPIIPKHAIKQSIWFFLNQWEFSPNIFKITSDVSVTELGAIIIDNEVDLRADTDFEHLLKLALPQLWDSFFKKLSPWHSYYIEKLCIYGQLPLYKNMNVWQLIGMVLLTEHPNVAIEMLNIKHPTISWNKGRLNYLLFSKENAARLLKEHVPLEVEQMYSLFVLAFNVDLNGSDLLRLYGISTKRLLEVAEHVAKIRDSHLRDDKLADQLGLPYLSVFSLARRQYSAINMDYARGFARKHKALEFLDIIGIAEVNTKPFVKGFNTYLYECLDWDEAAQEHFCFYLSSVMLSDSLGTMRMSLGEYIGVDIREFLPEKFQFDCTFVEHTVSNIPRQLNSYLEIINRLDRNEEENGRHMGFITAIAGSLLNDETVDNYYKERYVYYKLASPSYGFSYFSRSMELEYEKLCKSKNHGSFDEIQSFLYFERIVCRYCLELKPMDLHRGFSKLLADTEMSKVLRSFIGLNFSVYRFPLVFRGLKELSDALLKSFPLMTSMAFGIEKMPRMALLRSIYQALADPADLILPLFRNLFATQFLHH